MPFQQVWAHSCQFPTGLCVVYSKGRQEILRLCSSPRWQAPPNLRMTSILAACVFFSRYIVNLLN